MKSLKTILLNCVIIFIGSSLNAQTTTFNYTGGMQTYVVPTGVTIISIDVYGAQGGSIQGGQGGYAYGELAVTPGQTLFIFVGGQGGSTNVLNGQSNGGWNGGGEGGSGTNGASGGGASDVRVGGNALVDRVIVAGGGGGMDFDGTNFTSGGNGGGSIGESGIESGSPGAAVSTGGTQASGGVGATENGYSGGSGTLGIGGATAFYNNSSYEHGGGGGGGYYGGAAGHPWCSGAGGSSYIGGVSNGTTTTGGRMGAGLIEITAVCTANSIAPDIAILMDINGECSISQPTAPTATNNCGLPVVGVPNVSFPITTQGTTIVIWTYNDGHGNTSTQTQNVIITDNSDPVPNLANLPVVNGNCSVSSLTAPTATDNCAGTITGTHNATLPITAPGTTVVTWTYTDGNGNTATQTQNVIVTLPVATTTLNGITISATTSGATYQWINCENGNTPIAGATSQSYTATASGTYAVIVTQNGCSATSACVTVSILGLEEWNQTLFAIYPNPNQGTFKVVNEQPITIYITNTAGQLIATQELITGENTIEITQVESGIYFISARTEDGRSFVERVNLVR